MRVVVGGTFAYLHKGHEALLEKAFGIGDFVYIGLTSDGFVGKSKGYKIKSYSKRKKALASFASKFKKKFVIVKLEDRYGPSINGDFDAIVVSNETYKIAKEINRIRKSKRLAPLRIFRIKYERAYDRKPISSKRIHAKEIDRSGRRLGR